LTGPGYRQLTLAAGEQFQTRQVFAGGHGARVALAALAGGRFRLTVTDGDAARLCSREARGGQVACAWTPLCKRSRPASEVTARATRSNTRARASRGAGSPSVPRVSGSRRSVTTAS